MSRPPLLGSNTSFLESTFTRRNFKQIHGVTSVTLLLVCLTGLGSVQKVYLRRNCTPGGELNTLCVHCGLGVPRLPDHENHVNI